MKQWHNEWNKMFDSVFHDIKSLFPKWHKCHFIFFVLQLITIFCESMQNQKVVQKYLTSMLKNIKEMKKFHV